MCLLHTPHVEVPTHALRCGPTKADLLSAYHSGLTATLITPGSGQECFDAFGAGEEGTVTIEFVAVNFPFGAILPTVEEASFRKINREMSRKKDWWVDLSMEEWTFGYPDDYA